MTKVPVNISQFLKEQEEKPMLRFMTCGNVDDGKSTLIGRILYDSKLLTEDQIASLHADNQKSGTQQNEIDYALLLDGLSAEREQGITIDVAYRFFDTAKRKYIVADTPGHEQYTRNMATAASTADVAVILVNASKGIMTQTKRHSFIVSLMGIKNIVLAVNKMDLVKYDQGTYEKIKAEYTEFANQLNFASVDAIPISALKGENITTRSSLMPWYNHKSILEHLDSMSTKPGLSHQPMRTGVQWVNRPNSDFRGYAGSILSGTVVPGQEVIALPSGQRAKIDRIVSIKGDLEKAIANQAVMLTLDKEIDVSRGTVLSDPNNRPAQSDQFLSHIIWMSPEPMLPGRPYLFKSNNQTTTGIISALKHKININNWEHKAGKTLELNEVGAGNIALDKPIIFEPFEENSSLGSFIIIDRMTNETVGAGTIDFGLNRAANVHWQETEIDKKSRAASKRQNPKILWFTGLSGSGKSTIASIVERKLHRLGYHTYLLDGDNVRHGLNKDLGFTDVDRVENIRRIGEVSKLMVDAGLIVLVSFISPFRSERRMVRNIVETDEFMEIFVDTPIDVCEKRDVKGLYKKARKGLIKNFTGIDSPYEPPESAELTINTVNHDPEYCAEQIINYLEKQP